PILGFTTSGDGVRGAAERLGAARPRDLSTNLNGAVVEGLALLDKTLARSAVPLKIGTLVVFTGGADRAPRISREQLEGELARTSHDTFAVGVGSAMNDGGLRSIGRSGVFQPEDLPALGKAAYRLVRKAEAYARSFYLLSYCSPSRAGEHVM